MARKLYILLLLLFGLSIIIQAQISKEEIIRDLHLAYSNGGVDSVISSIHSLCNEFPDSLSSLASAAINVAVEMFKDHNRRDAINVLEKSKEFFGNDIRIYSVLGQFYWFEEQRDSCISNFRKCLDINPEYSLAKKYMNLLFFVPEDFEVPKSLQTKNMRIRPLLESDAELDYKAVMSSINHIRGVFGPDDDWPRDDLTFEDDVRALKNHEDEFHRRSAFTYTVMDQDEKNCLGCIYILPIHAKGYDAQVFLWVTSDAFQKGYDKELYKDVKNWLHNKWPFKKIIFPGRDMEWETYNAIQE